MSDFQHAYEAGVYIGALMPHKTQQETVEV